MTAYEQRVLRGLEERMQAHSNGVLALFKQAGIYTETPKLTDLQLLQEINPEIFAAVIEFLYPEIYANGDGKKGSDAESGKSGKTSSSGPNLGWTTFVGALLSGVGMGLLGPGQNQATAEETSAERRQELAQAEMRQRTIKIAIIGAVVIAVAIALIVVFKKK